MQFRTITNDAQVRWIDLVACAPVGELNREAQMIAVEVLGSARVADVQDWNRFHRSSGPVNSFSICSSDGGFNTCPVANSAAPGYFVARIRSAAASKS